MPGDPRILLPPLPEETKELIASKLSMVRKWFELVKKQSLLLKAMVR